MAKIQNQITINADFDLVFDATNDIENWPQLFTEYKEAIVLEKKENYVLFRLTTHPQDGHESHSWKSERFIDKPNKKIKARRLEPLLPFKFMNIEWLYKEHSNATEMIWIQEFEVDPASGYSEEAVVNHLNEASREQLMAIKNNVEKLARVTL